MEMWNFKRLAFWQKIKDVYMEKIGREPHDYCFCSISTFARMYMKSIRFRKWLKKQVRKFSASIDFAFTGEHQESFRFAISAKRNDFLFQVYHDGIHPERKIRVLFLDWIIKKLERNEREIWNFICKGTLSEYY